VYSHIVAGNATKNRKCSIFVASKRTFPAEDNIAKNFLPFENCAKYLLYAFPNNTQIMFLIFKEDW